MQTVRLLGGAATGLVAHEGGHIVFGAIFGAHPSIKALRYGPIRFFRIDHDAVTPKEEFVITSAGFWCNTLARSGLHRAPESSPRVVAVQGDPRVQSRDVCDAATAAFGQFGPPRHARHRRTYDDGKDAGAGCRRTHPRAGRTDGWRYLHPDARRRASRAAKIGMALLTLR
jgi:hypothetical protein